MANGMELTQLDCSRHRRHHLPAGRAGGRAGDADNGTDVLYNFQINCTFEALFISRAPLSVVPDDDVMLPDDDDVMLLLSVDDGDASEGDASSAFSLGMNIFICEYILLQNLLLVGSKTFASTLLPPPSSYRYRYPHTHSGWIFFFIDAAVISKQSPTRPC
jgi:hypothetical protein